MSHPFSGGEVDMPGFAGRDADPPPPPAGQASPAGPPWSPSGTPPANPAAVAAGETRGAEGLAGGSAGAVDAGRAGSGRGGSRRRLLIGGLSILAIACLVAAALTGMAAYKALTRGPTAAERSAAAAVALSGRWRSWSAGRIFPYSLSYSTSLLTNESAIRLGISPRYNCAAAIDGSLVRTAERLGCQAGVRATYLDQLQGIVYTIGVLAFPDERDARRFLAAVRPAGRGPIPLRALALRGTASARFSDAARQASSATVDGPFVILSTAGYADGRPAAATAEARQSIFAPAVQLASEIGSPLLAPVQVTCDARYWSC